MIALSIVAAPPAGMENQNQSPPAGVVEVASPFVSPFTVSSLYEVKYIGASAVPWAFNVPFTVMPDMIPLNFTITPGLMVRVTPALIAIPVVTMYVLLAVVQV